jgi:hypothetical protein
VRHCTLLQQGLPAAVLEGAARASLQAHRCGTQRPAEKVASLTIIVVAGMLLLGTLLFCCSQQPAVAGVLVLPASLTTV